MPTNPKYISNVEMPDGSLLEVKDTVARQMATSGTHYIGKLYVDGSTYTHLTDNDTRTSVEIVTGTSTHESHNAVQGDIVLDNGNEFIWKNFAIALNNDILKHCNDGMIAEDKLLGTHFVKENELKDIKIFAEKVFMYLWNDVVKYNKEQLFNPKYATLDEVIDAFIKGKNVFNDGCEIGLLYKQFEENNEININEENEKIDEE